MINHVDELKLTMKEAIEEGHLRAADNCAQASSPIIMRPNLRFHIVRGSTTSLKNAPAFESFERSLHTNPENKHAYYFENAIALGNGFPIFKNRFIRESLYMANFLDKRVDQVRTFRKDLSKSPKVWISCSNASSNNYWHWLAQSLPAILHSIKFLKSEKIIEDEKSDVGLLAPKLNSMQMQCLEIVELSSLERITIHQNECVLVPRLCYSSQLGGPLPFAPTEERLEVRELFLNAAKGISHQNSQKIYVSRKDTNKRPLLNEEELIQEISKIGFKAIPMGALDILNQVSIFRDADLILGPHGAGLTSTLFCRPEATTIELAQASYTNAGPASMMRVSGARLFLDVFDDDGLGQKTLGWNCNINKVLETVDLASLQLR